MLCCRCRFWFTEGFVGFLAAALLAASGLAAFAQSTAITEGGNETERAVREIDDPACGTRWMLVPNAEHPGGPGQLISVPGNRKDSAKPGRGRPEGARTLRIVPPPHVLIRGGDQLIVEQNTPILAAHLAAVALGPASVGKLLQARLQINGKAVWVVALGPGRASLASVGEVRR